MTQVIIRIHYVHNLPHQLHPPRLYCLADYWGFAAGNQRSAMDYIPRLTFNVPSSNKWWEMDERRREREQEECEDKAAACRWILRQLMVCGYMRHCVCACEHVPKCLCLSKSSSCHQEQEGNEFIRTKNRKREFFSLVCGSLCDWRPTTVLENTRGRWIVYFHFKMYLLITLQAVSPNLHWNR